MMLVLSRKQNEHIRITTPQGQVIDIAVVELMGTKVRLGVTADSDIAIHREEVAERIAAGETQQLAE